MTKQIGIRYKNKQYNVRAKPERMSNLERAAKVLDIDLEQTGGIQQVYDACVEMVALYFEKTEEQNETPA